MYNASERRDVRSKEKQAKLAERSRHEITAYIMSTAPSRAWMHDLLSYCGVGQTPFTGVNDHTNFNCGMQSVGLRLLGDISAACPDQYIQMMKEAEYGRNADDARQRRDNSNGDGGDSASTAEGGDDGADD